MAAPCTSGVSGNLGGLLWQIGRGRPLSARFVRGLQAVFKSKLTLFSLTIAVLSIGAAILSMMVALPLVFGTGRGGTTAQRPGGPAPEPSAIAQRAAVVLTAVPDPSPTRVSPSPISVPPTQVPRPASPASTAAASPPKEVGDYALLATRDICLAERCDNQQIVRSGHKLLSPADSANSITDSWCLVIQYDSHGCFEERKALVVNVIQVKDGWGMRQFNSWDFDQCMLPSQ